MATHHYVVMSLFTIPYCQECGEAPVPHRLEKLSKTIDDFMFRSFLAKGIFGFVEKRVTKFALSLIPTNFVIWLLDTGTYLGAFNKSDMPLKDENTRTLALYEGAAEKNVTLLQYRIGSLPLAFIAIKNDGTSRKNIFTVIPRPAGFESPSLEWMDDKGILKEKMAAGNIPHADGGAARTYPQALAIFRRLNASVIIKPQRGSRGRHTTLDIRTEEELKRAFDIGMQITTSVVVEKYLHGTVHRVTLVGGEPVAIARREYPHVVGDGTHTVDELIEIENKNPLRNGLHFRKLDKAHRAPEALRKQDLTLESVPKNGQMVIINDKNSRLHGTTTEDVTDTVHPENIALFKRFAVLLGDPIVGVDFMINDMKRPWTEQPDAGVLECNAMPFIDVHHQVISGRKINVAAYLWDVVFPPLTKEKGRG
jgi:D-alanine-D-alanine ligase-like ATP-grasp enzyme